MAEPTVPKDSKSSPVLSANNVIHNVRFGSQLIQILNGVTFALGENSSVVFTGKSGSGKTTLLGLLAGLDTAKQGEIHLLGQEITRLDEDQRAILRRGQVGFVFQSFQLLPNLTALENVSLALEVVPGIDSIISRSTDALERVGLSHRLGHLPGQLSGGEQQRVALARAMVTRPRIIFADEPTGNLDSATGTMIVDMLFELCAELNCSLVLVSHDKQLATRCHIAYELIQGRLV
ncbi:MAG: putative ABC transport system ATP-binding protein [Parasphingorhabdus sp.]|jgi:putative ABC transport system ATP-binding protein